MPGLRLANNHGGSRWRLNTPPIKTYDEPTLDALEHALRDVWEVLKAHEPLRDWDDDNELKSEVARMLMALADTGLPIRKNCLAER